MSETYQSKRERRQRLLEALPEGLRDYVSIRNVEAVASLTTQAQERLAEAIQSGLKRLPRAIEQLRVNPNSPITELLNLPTLSSAEQKPITQHIQKELADLIQQCFPDMPRLSAEALAGAEVMDIARQTAQVHHELLHSNHLHTDFVMIVSYTLVRQTLERLEEMIANTPALRQAFEQSSLPIKPNDWRTQDAQTNR